MIRAIKTKNKSGDIIREEVEALPCGVRGLSIIEIEPNEWNVSHNASGYAIIYSLPSEREAELAAKKLKPLADWTLGGSKLAKDKKLAKAVRRLRNEFNNPE